MQTNLYFVSILVTCALTGWLAFYAWRKGDVPGAHAYARMAFCECLLALAEIFSMISPTQALALFWFQFRFLFIAAIPVLWLVFALEYQGRKNWLSKNLLGGMFIIPVITQIILWSNNLHGLWVKQEVSFHQSGLFWLAETSSRIPGFWFMVHSFYSLLLLVFGVGVILVTAWKMQRLYKVQALLLSGGALIALATTLVPLFNLIPQGGINPFIPGIGASALLYALAIFRFQFLKRAPAEETNKQKTSSTEVPENRPLLLFLFIFVLMATGIAAVGYQSYQDYERQFRFQVENQLSSIATLKASELQRWRNERLADAETLYQNPALSSLVERYFEDPADTLAKNELQAWLNVYDDKKRYDQALLVDVNGVERITTAVIPEPVANHIFQELPAALSTGQVTFLDFHRYIPNGPIHLSLLIPVLANQDHRPLGLLVLRIDPQTFLYPFIQQWPVPSTTAETLLVRREGEDVLYLNPLRFQSDTAMNLRLPLVNTEILAVKAVLGLTGITEALDYRSVPVIGDVRPVPDSPWFLVSRIDTAEVYAPLRDRLLQTIVFFGTLTLAAGVGLAQVWRQQRIRYFQARQKASEALRVSEEKFRKLFNISDAIIISRLSDGQFVSVNQSFTIVLGYSETDVIGKSSLELDIWVDSEDRKKIVEDLQTNGIIENYEAMFRTKTGELRNGLMSAALIELDGEVHIINSARDITEQRRAEEALRKSAESYRNLFEQAADGIFIADAHGNYVDVNSSGCNLLGYTREEVLHLNMKDLVSADDQTKIPLRMNELQSGKNVVSERRMRHKNGALIDVEISGRMLQDGRIQGMVRDISDRKQAEKKLHQRNEYLVALQETTLDLLSRLEIRDLLENIVRRAGSLFGTSSGYLELVDPKDGILKPKVGMGALRESLRHTVQPGEGIAGTVWQTGEPLVVNDYDHWTSRIGSYTPGLLSSAVGVPLHSGGKVLGILGLGFDFAEQRTFEQEDIEILIQFGRLAAIAIENARLFSVAQQELAEHNRAERLIRARLNLLELSISHSLVEVLQATLDEVGELTGSPIGFYHFVENDQTTLSLQAWSTRTLHEFCQAEGTGLHYPIDQAGVWVDCVHSKKPVFHNDYANLPHRKGLPEGHAPILRELVVPLLRSEVIVAIIGVGNKSTDYAPEDAELLSYFADIAWEIAERKRQETEILAAQTDLQRMLAKADRSRHALLSVVEDQKLAQEEIRRLNAELEQRVADRTAQLVTSNKELEAFAYSVSHDLRAPLRAIDGFSRILKEEYSQKLDDEGLRLLGVIRNNTNKMDHLIVDLLALSRVSRSELKFSPVDMTTLVKSMYHEVATPEVLEKFKFRVSELPNASCDPTLIRQVWTNLISNAIKYTLPKEECVIEIDGSEENGLCTYMIKDNGVGFNPKYTDKLFGLFQRLHKAGEFEGTGVGLAIVQRIIHRHGGRIWGEGLIGIGATFYFTIPVRQENYE